MNNKTETLGEKLESIDCRRDDKARRVSNCAPDTVAEITANELENGVSLERLDGLNVPVLRYSTQLTIHGKLPEFNPAARPGGYKAIFQNGNGSIGVRFSAIDAEKKAVIRRASRVGVTGWHTFANCSGFYIQKSFYVREETQRAEQRAATVAALQSFPVSLFYGNAGAYSLPYGIGYAVEVNLGAIPAENVAPFVLAVFGLTLAEVEAKETEQAAKDAEERAARQAEREKAGAQRAVEIAATLAGFVPVAVLPENGVVTVHTAGELITVKLEKVKGRNFYTVTKRGGSPTYNPRKACPAFPWPKALAAGRVYSEKGAEVAAAPAPVAVSDTAAPLDSEKAAQPATKNQSFALFCATGKDFRGLFELRGLTYGEASSAIAAAQPFRASKNKAAALAAVSALIGQPIAL